MSAVFVLFDPLIDPGLHVRYPIPIVHLKVLMFIFPHHVSTALDKHQHVVCEGAPFPGGFAIDLSLWVVELILVEDLSERSGCAGRGTGFDATGQRRCWNPGDCHDTQAESTYDDSSDILHRRLRVYSCPVDSKDRMLVERSGTIEAKASDVYRNDSR